MEEKNIKELQIFFDIIMSSYYFHAVKVDSTPHIVEELIHRIEELDYDAEAMLSYQNIYWIKSEFSDEDFDRLVSNTFNKSLIKGSYLMFFSQNKETDTFYIFEMSKPSKKGTRKTLQQLELDLEQALKIEDYKLAATLRDKINTRKTKKPRRKK